MHISENERAMRELIRVVRPGGSIVIAETNFYSFDCLASRFAAAIFRRAS